MRELPEIPKDKRPSALLKSPALRTVVIVIPLVTLFFAVILALQQGRIATLQKEQADLQAANAQLQTENLFYKKSYEITLEDIQMLSRAYAGNDERYTALASELRQKELGTVLGVQTNASAYSLRNPLLWQEYRTQGVINASCLPGAAVVDTIADEVLLTIDTMGGGNVSLYIDGNFLEVLNGSGTHQVSVNIPGGTHELDLIAKTPSEVRKLLMDTTSLPLDAAVIDAGRGWAVFDCKNATVGTVFLTPGALRIPFVKK